jgi:hypothetical protein
MRRYASAFSALVLLVTSVVLALMLTACGGSNNPATATTTPAPTATAPTPSPTPGPGTGGGGASSAPTQYSASIDDNTSHTTGQLTVDTAGKGTLSLKTTPSTSVAVSWCNFPGTTGCLSIGTFPADASGTLNATFTFPAHGNFAGIFDFTAGGATHFAAGWNIPNGSSPFQAQLLPAGSVSAGLGQAGAQIGVGNDPLSSGTVSIAAGSSIAHFTVQGALPNANYPATYCFNSGSSSCFALGVLITNASGSGTFDIDLTKAAIGSGSGFSGVFFLHRQTDPQHAPYEYVSGFKVP